jgi:hypothetical protein
MTMPVPAWIVFVAIVGLYAVQHVTVARRVDSHARILAHMDRWANSVEVRLDVVGQALGHAPAQRHEPSPKQRQNPKEFRNLSNDQVRALISRIVGTRAA